MVVLREGFNPMMILKMCHHGVSINAQSYPLIQSLEREMICFSFHFTLVELVPEA